MRQKAFVLLFLSLCCQSPKALADVKSSKINTYTVVAPPNGVVVSKTNAYTVVAPQDGVVISKSNAYILVTPPTGVIISRSVMYAVVGPPAAGSQQPSVFIMTKRESLDPIRTKSEKDPQTWLLNTLLPLLAER